MLKLKLQYFVYLMRWLDGITGSMDMSFEQTPGDGEGQRSLVCCSPWGHKELDMTEQEQLQLQLMGGHTHQSLHTQEHHHEKK